MSPNKVSCECRSCKYIEIWLRRIRTYHKSIYEVGETTLCEPSGSGGGEQDQGMMGTCLRIDSNFNIITKSNGVN